MRFSLLVAGRILSGVRQPYLSVVSKIAVVGVALGVSALVVVFSISEGFSTSFQDKILSLYPHMVILRRGTDFRDHLEIAKKMQSIEGVSEAVSATYDELMVVHGDRRGQVILKGMPLSSASLSSRLNEAMSEGKPIQDIAPRLRANLNQEQNQVLIRGGVQGIIGQIAVLENDAGALKAIIQQPLWVRPGTGWGRITLLAPTGMEVVCFAGAMEYRFTIPPHGGFSAARNIVEGNHICKVSGESPHAQDDRSFDLIVRSGKIHTVVLDREGSLWEMDAIEERGDPNRLASSIRVYWPSAKEFALRTPEGRLVQVQGSVSPWTRLENLPLPGILLGKTVAESLRAKVGDEIRLMTPLRGIDGSSLGPIGMAPSSLKARVHGLLHTGFHEFDNRFAITDLRLVQRFFNRGDDVRWVEIRVQDVEKTQSMVDSVSRSLDDYGLPDLLGAMTKGARDFRRLGAGEVSQLKEGELGPVGYLKQSAQAGQYMRTTAVGMVPDKEYRVIDWRRMNRNLLSAIRLQRVVLTIFFLIITFVAASNVVGNQIMLIHEKTRTIAILRAMGASRRQIFWIFRLQGLITTAIGSALGAGLGYTICWLLGTYPLPLNAEIYFIETLPMELSLAAIFTVVMVTLAGTWFATTFSARRAAAISPVAGLHRVE